jgi:TRAP-type C4-dicarboxylate transport system substrate-binding protein
MLEVKRENMKWLSVRGNKARITLLLTVFMAVMMAVTLIPACTDGNGGTTTPTGTGNPTETIKPQPGAITLTCVSGWTKPWTGLDKLDEFIARVNKESNGRLFIKYLGGAEVAPITESGGLVRDGVFDMVLNSPAYYAGLCPAAVITHFTPEDPVLIRELGQSDLLNGTLRQKMNCYSPGQLWRGEHFGILSQEALLSADFKGLVSHTLPIFTPGLTYLRASTTTLTTAEFYVGLERGVIDMCPQPVGAVPWDLRLYEVAKNIMDPFLPIVTSGPLIINGRKWDSLPDDLKKLINDIVIDMEPGVYTYFKNVESTYQAKMEAQGVKVNKLSAEDAAKVIYAFSTYTWKDTIKTNGDLGKEFFESSKPYFDWAKDPAALPY